MAARISHTFRGIRMEDMVAMLVTPIVQRPTLEGKLVLQLEFALFGHTLVALPLSFIQCWRSETCFCHCKTAGVDLGITGP